MNKQNVKVHSILDMDATAVAEAIKQNQLTSLEAVTTYIEHIKKVNPEMNAVVEERFADAIQEAKEMDLVRDEDSDKPLFGVPISVKEAYNIKNMKTTSGLLSRQNVIANQDSHVVTKLKNAGAIILGKTNTPELCFCQETDNKLYGRTNNPWDLTRTVGGSSGGEGALLAAGGAAVGIGSDIGGSIRFPSHFNGVVGFKSGKFQVSPEGHFTDITISLQQRMLGLGPLAKSVRDAQLLYNIIATKPAPHKLLETFQMDILPSETMYPLSPKSRRVMDKVEKFLGKSFSTARKIPPYFENSARLWQEIMSIDGGKGIGKIALPNKRSSPLIEYSKERLFKKSVIHPYLSWALIGAKLFKPSVTRTEEIKTIIKQGDTRLADYLDNRLLIFPVYHTGALKHGKVYQEIFSIWKTFMKYMPFVAYGNVWGLPSLTVPVAIDENNMPISIQIMSTNGNEDALFQLGKMIESAFRGYVRCRNLD